jgi:hypothetical protein
LQLKHIKKVVIDEVDETLSLGFRPQLLRIFEFLPAKKQVLIDKVAGSFNSRFTQLNIVLHGFDTKVKNIVVNGKRVAISRAANGTASASIANLASSISIGY